MPEEQDFLYVDDGLKYLTGSEARAALLKKSDQAFLNETKGVVRVPKARWEEAQRYERDTWMRAGADASDDRNTEHLRQFDGYAAIAGRRFRNAIEIGCGPFTNLRLIARVCPIHSCTLLDPLINEYLHHDHCAYDRRGLRIREKPIFSAMGRVRWTGRLRRAMARRFPSLVFSTVPITQLIASPVEEARLDPVYDLAVMINVLEHCFDAERVLETIGRMLARGGVLVFHDKCFQPDEIRHDVSVRFDAGHPLRVQADVIDTFLRENFEPVFVHDEVVPDSFEHIDLSRNGIYFIGTKRA